MLRYIIIIFIRFDFEKKYRGYSRNDEEQGPLRDGSFRGLNLEEAALIKSGPRRQIEGRAEINQPFVLRL